MNRTDELKNRGARKIGSDSCPFVKWGDEYAFLEGTIETIWEGEYGPVARLLVSGVSDGLPAQIDKESPPAPIEPGQRIHVGLNYASLSGVGESLVGSKVHIGYQGWGMSKGGKRFRDFSVYELEAADASGAPPWGDDPDDQVPF